MVRKLPCHVGCIGHHGCVAFPSLLASPFCSWVTLEIRS